MAQYIDYLTNNNDVYFPYTVVQAIINTDGNPLTQWITKINTHNHDIRYAAASHNHDNRYSLMNHVHNDYAIVNHTHNYAGSASVGGAANTALKLDKPFTLSITGSSEGSATLDGSSDVEINLNTKHNHDLSYIRRDGSDEIYIDTGVQQAFSIVGNGGLTKINFFESTNRDDKGYIQYYGSSMIVGYNHNTLKVTNDGAYYNDAKLASEAFVMECINNLLQQISN